MEKKGLKLPKIDDVRKKARSIDGAKNVTLKEEDIEQVEMQSPISSSLLWLFHVNYILGLDHTREAKVQKNSKKLRYEKK